MMNLLTLVGNIGSDQFLSIKAKGKIKLINIFGLFACLFTSIFSGIYYFASDENLWLYCILFSVSYLIPIILNYFKLYNFSKSFLIILIAIICFVMSCVVGKDAYLQFALIFPVGLSFVLFDSKAIKYRMLFISISVAGFILLEISDYSLFKRIILNENVIHYSHFIIGLLIFVFLVFVLQAFTNNNEKSEKELEQWHHIFKYYTH